MRTIVHLSDLHFGRVDYAILEPLTAKVISLEPDLIAVSGDLTQRARSEQFKEAKRFLDGLPFRQIVVPGNHDVPLYNAFSRFLGPLDKYRRYITDDLQPFYSDEEIAVLGISTARSLTIKDGRINAEQVAEIRQRFCVAGKATKILVTHHPFDLPEGHRAGDLVGRAQLAMEAMASCGVDLLLAGHLHISHTGQTTARYQVAGHSAVVVSAGTATSVRGRGEVNSFNVIRISQSHINVERMAWQAERASFGPTAAENFARSPEGWARIPDEAAAGFVYAPEARVVESMPPSRDHQDEPT